jgi:hypothetical protein
MPPAWQGIYTDIDDGDDPAVLRTNRLHMTRLCVPRSLQCETESCVYEQICIASEELSSLIHLCVFYHHTLKDANILLW